MCGLAGLFSPRVTRERLARMERSLEHRGPDGRGYLLLDPDGLPTVSYGEPPEAGPLRGGLVHRRLAILDLSEASSQPMGDEQVYLVYNGELYNYVELRRELEAQGSVFRSTGDTEVLLKAYSRWGTDCFARFRGMWALALLDLERRALVLSRDRFGIKPLYLRQQDGELAFASEIKALLAVAPAGPNAARAADFLRTGRVDHGLETFFAGIHRFPAACWGIFRLDEPTAPGRIEPYWRPPATDSATDEGLRELLLDSVRLHYRSDVPVGACLSGGLDSSAIVCARPGPVRAYGYVAEDDSEETFMRAVAESTGADLQLVRFAPDGFEADLEAFVACQDEPCGSASGLAQWLVFRAAARDGVKVMLDGQGADELLAGYPWYAGTLAREHLSRGRLWSLAALLGSWWWHGLDPDFGLRDLLRRPRPAAPDPLLQLAPRLAQAHPPRRSRVYDRLEEQLRDDALSLNLPGLLRFEDTNSMAHSVEARVPFLDHPLAELALRLRSASKIRGCWTKWALRRAVDGLVPTSIVKRRDKMGFRASSAGLRGYLARNRDLLSQNRSPLEQDWLDPERVRRALEPTTSGYGEDFRLWRLTHLKLWLREHWP